MFKKQKTKLGKISNGMKKNVYDGLQNKIKNLKLPKIDTWDNKYPEKDYVVKIEIPEFTSICPYTALPDFARIVIRYIPDKLCVELKSLKYYTIAYRDIGIFNENVVNKMLDDIVKSCAPKWVEITGEFNARGGIKTTVSVEYKQ
jgi:7-cyano-7-deazaguanine reductase